MHVDGDVIIDGDLTVNGNSTTWTIGIDELDEDKFKICNSETLGCNDFVLTTNGYLGLGITNPTEALHVNGNVLIEGDLFIDGTFTTINSETLTINDPLIKLALGNASDLKDIGFYGCYVDSGITKFSGFYRDASDEKYHLFKELEVDPTTTVDKGHISYEKADLCIGNLTVFGDIGVTGLVDGRDILLDGTVQDAHIANITSNPHNVTLEQISPTTEKGDIIVDNGVTTAKFPVGIDGDIIIADSTAPLGVTYVSIVNEILTETYYNFIESTSIQSTLSTTYTEYLSLTTNSLVAGTYKINFTYVWNADPNDKNGHFRIQIDDTTTISEEVNRHQHLKIEDGARVISTGFAIEVLTAGVHTIDLDFRSQDSGKTINIYESRIDLHQIL